MICKACTTEHAKKHYEIMFLADYAEEMLAKKLDNIEKTINEGSPIFKGHENMMESELNDLSCDLEKCSRMG